MGDGHRDRCQIGSDASNISHVANAASVGTDKKDQAVEEGVGCSNFKIGRKGFTDHDDAPKANFEILTPDPRTYGRDERSAWVRVIHANH